MNLTVDQLLLGDSSSDDEGFDVRPAAASAKAVPSVNGAVPSTSGLGGQPAKRPVLTVEQALAAGDDLSDDDDDVGSPPSVAPPVQEDARHGTEEPNIEEDQLSDASRDHTEDAKNLVGLDAILAMGSDSSGDEAPAPRQVAGAVPEKIYNDDQAARSETVAPAHQTHSRDQKAEGVSDGEERDTFMRAPFEWCLEHERALLMINAEESIGGEQKSGTKVEQRASSLGGSSEAVASLSMVETRPCLGLRPMLAQTIGLPTCVATHNKWVGVGSLRGAVVIIDSKIRDVASEPMVLCPVNADDAVAVTSAAFSPDGTSMLVGHKNGQLVLWDLASQKVVTMVRDVHSSAVLAVAFCRASWQFALSADATGKVCFLSFTTSTFGRRDCKSQLLLEQSSNVGITLRICPVPTLSPVPNQDGHPADAQCLVALCATNATVLMTLHPSAKLLQKMQYHSKDIAAQAAWVPDVAWLRLEKREWIEHSQAQSCDPQLCIAFGQTLHIMRVSFEKDAVKMKEDFKISLLHRFTWNAPIQSIAAFNESMLVILDTANKLSVVPLPSSPEDPKPTTAGPSQQLASVHSEDVSTWSLAYHTYTSLDGSKDSRCHHGALATYRGKLRTLYICGMKEVWSLQIGRWGQRVEELVNKDDWSTALDVFSSLHKGSIPPLLDFPQAVSSRQRAVDACTTSVIQSYLVSQLQQVPGRDHAKRMCHIAVSVCIEMRLWSVLYKNVFASFKDAGHMNVYCNTLEPFIVTGRIPRDHMDSEVLSSILQTYADRLEDEEKAANEEAATSSRPLHWVDCDHCQGLFPVARRLQQLVMYVDVSQLDLNLAIRLFTRHGLWTALVHVYCALGDYISPLELLIGECVQLAKKCLALRKEGEPEIERPMLQCFLVRKLFFYLYRCFQLQTFPIDVKEGGAAGMAQPGPIVVVDLLQSMFKLNAGKSAGTATTAPLIFLRLLRLSPVGLFSACAELYTSPSATEAIGGQICKLGELSEPLSPNTLFRGIETAVHACKLQAEEEQQPLPANTDSEFLWFKARAIPTAQLELPVGELMQVVEHLLATTPEAKRHGVPTFGCHSAEEAQQLLIGVLDAQEALGQSARDALVSKATQKGFFGVASWIHERHGDYDRALDCRMQDEELRSGIFDYIISRLTQKSSEQGNTTAALVEATLQRLQRLVAIDAERCAVMICEQFASVADHTAVLARLHGHPQMELQYLETLLVLRSRLAPEGFFDAHVVRYIELLCSITPGSVLAFIQENETLPLRECLELCRKHAVTDASVHLLERTGDFAGVLELLLHDYDRALEKLRISFVENRAAVAKLLKKLGPSAKGQGACNAPDQESPWWEGLQDAQRCVDLLDHAYEMSSRNSNIMEDALLEELWFGVLERTVRLQERERSTCGDAPKKWQVAFVAALAELASKAMGGVLAYLSLPRSLNWICDKFGSSQLGLWKDPLQSVLSGLSFKQGLLSAAKSVAAQDVVKPFMAMKRRGSHGVRFAPETLPIPGASGELKVRLPVPLRGRGAGRAVAVAPK